MSKEQWLKKNLKKGEHYAGIILGKDGAPDYHLIGLPGQFSGTWDEAMAWAKSIEGELPNRRELLLLWVNAKDHYGLDGHWACEQHASHPDYAWYQHFTDGSQTTNGKHTRLQASAVRRLPLENSNER